MKMNSAKTVLFVATTMLYSTHAVSLPFHQESLAAESSKTHLRGQAVAASGAEANSSVNALELGIDSKLAMLAASPGANSTMASGLEDQLTDLFKMRSTMTKEQFDATPFGASVKKILHLIEGVMMPQVTHAHDENQKHMHMLRHGLDMCGDTKNQSVHGANLKKANYERVSPLHRTCRMGEAGQYQEKSTCWEEEADKKKIMQLKCQAFDMVKKQVGDQQANKQIMVKAGGESTESYVARIAATVCGKCAGKGCKLLATDADNEDDPNKKQKKCGYDPYTCGCGFQCKFDKAKDACDQATKEWQHQDKKCTNYDKQFVEKRKECDSLQDQMDDSACHRAVDMKDACESYEECHFDKKKAYLSMEKMVKGEEIDRKAEWKGLQRMKCLISAFADKKVSNKAIELCKSAVHGTDHLIIQYPGVPPLDICEVPHLYPSTPSYKVANFEPLPALAKGKQDAYECVGITEISTDPAEGSPKECKCTRVTLNGPYTPGAMVKCENCLDVRRSLEKNSCPDGTKLFAPSSKSDWKTLLNSVEPLKAPNWIIDVTRPRPGCGGCTRKPMTNHWQKSFKTSDGAAWWLRSTRYSEPSGDYQANCYMSLWKSPFKDESHVTFNDANCAYHSKSYFCQSKQVSVVPKVGSPRGCVCKMVALTGKYSAGSLMRCVGCLRVSRSTQKNSCPIGTKLFSPRSRADWKTFIASATPLRSPNWIIDVTQPQNGCGGCTRNAMSSRNPAQATWMTTDRTAWYLRGSKYSEPNGDYKANCYLDLGTIANENSVTFNDHNCNYNSNAYYCQTAKVKKAPEPVAEDEPEPVEPPKPKAGGLYKGFKCAAGAYTPYTLFENTTCGHFTNMTEDQCWDKCKNNAHAKDKESCDKERGFPDCVANVYDKKSKVCMLHRWCGHLEEWEGHTDIVTRLKKNYEPRGDPWDKVDGERCVGKPYSVDEHSEKEKCVHACFENKVLSQKHPVKKCVAMTFKPDAKQDGDKKAGTCSLYAKCEKTTDKKAAKGQVTFKKKMREGDVVQKEKKGKKDDDDEEEKDEDEDEDEEDEEEEDEDE